MLAGFTPWPAADVARWKAAGHRPGRRVGDIVADAAARLPDKTAVIDADRRLSYAELLQRADQLARRLQDSGLEREDRVVMQLTDAAVGRHHLAVQADPAHPRRLRAERPPVRPGRRLRRAARCSWPSCRWATTTTWPRPGMLGASTRRHRGAGALGRCRPRSSAWSKREKVTVIAAVVPLISNWLNSPMVPTTTTCRSLKVVQNGGARLAPGAAPAGSRALGLHAAGDLRHRRGPDQHDPLDARLDLHPQQFGRAGVRGRRDQGGRRRRPGSARRRGRRTGMTRGPYTIRGYYGRRRRTARPSRPTASTAWATSCARGRHVFTEGRRKDLINRGGEKISCEEVENLIFGHPRSRPTLVAMPDPVFGEKACAFVICQARRKPGLRRADRLPARADRQLQAARAAGGGRAVSPQPGRQDPQARNCANDRGKDGRPRPGWLSETPHEDRASSAPARPA
jgi:hypothetical protein